MGHEAAEGDAASQEAGDLTRRARGVHFKGVAMSWHSRRWFGVPIALVKIPVKPSFAESPVLLHRAFPLKISIVIDPRIAGHEGGSRKPGSGFS